MMKRGEEVRFVFKSLSHVGGNNIGNGGVSSGWCVFDSSQRTNTVGHSADERIKGPRSPSP